MLLKGISASLGGGALLAGAAATATVSVPGAQIGQAVSCSPAIYPGDGIIWMAYISANDVVTVKVVAILALTPTASTYAVWVHQ